jgi:LPXTG-motif cell wall-anchored protein
MKVKVTSRRVLTFSFLLGLVLLFFGGATNTQALPPETSVETWESVVDTTVEPEDTVDETVPETVPETTAPEETVPETTSEYYGPTPSCPEIDGVFQYPQSYDTDAPCGPEDPCVGIDPATGQGTTLWMLQPCSVDVPTSTVAVAVGQELPQTGASTIFFVIGALVLFIGITMTVTARR